MSDTPLTWGLAGRSCVPAGDWWLTPDERRAQQRFVVPKRRADWRAGRWVAKGVLAATSGLPKCRIGVLARSEDDGFPVVEGLAYPTPRVSISHSDGLAVAAVAPTGEPVGCDLERIEPRPLRFAEDWFTPSECRRIEQANGPIRDELVTLTWSTKEAALKAIGDGLRRDTRDVEVEFPVGDHERRDAPTGSAVSTPSAGSTVSAAFRWSAVSARVAGGPLMGGWSTRILGLQLVFISTSPTIRRPPTRIWPEATVSCADCEQRNYCPKGSPNSARTPDLNSGSAPQPSR